MKNELFFFFAGFAYLEGLGFESVKLDPTSNAALLLKTLGFFMQAKPKQQPKVNLEKIKNVTAFRTLFVAVRTKQHINKKSQYKVKLKIIPRYES